MRPTRIALRVLRCGLLAAAGWLTPGCTLEDVVRQADLETDGRLEKSESLENDRTACPRTSYWEMSRMR
jgi:hypothetical protein